MYYSSQDFLKYKTAKQKKTVEANDIIHQAQFVTPHGENKYFPSIKRHHVCSELFHGKWLSLQVVFIRLLKGIKAVVWRDF